MSDCSYCHGTGIEPNIGGLCVRCAGSGSRRPGSDPHIEKRAETIHCLCGMLIEYCPVRDGHRCPPVRVAP